MAFEEVIQRYETRIKDLNQLGRLAPLVCEWPDYGGRKCCTTLEWQFVDKSGFLTCANHLMFAWAGEPKTRPVPPSFFQKETK